MGTLKGLAAIRAFSEKQAEAAKEREERLKTPKVEYLNLSDGQSVRVRFLQEMDAESENFDSARGTGTGVVEHVVFVKALGRMYRTTCTIEDEGRCYGCERYRAGDKEFAQKKNYYINALIDFMDGEKPKTMIVSRSLGSSFFGQLYEEADEAGTLTAVNYKITRRGSGTDTKWSLREIKNDELLDDTKAAIYDIDDEKTGVIKSFPYEATNEKASQEQYFAGETYNTKSDSATSTDTEDARPKSKADYDIDASW